jgi:hypothetical protein
VWGPFGVEGETEAAEEEPDVTALQVRGIVVLSWRHDAVWMEHSTCACRAWSSG